MQCRVHLPHDLRTGWYADGDADRRRVAARRERRRRGRDLAFRRGELFGPAVAVSSAEDWEGAIAQANGTAYGLSKGPGNERIRR